MKGLRIYAPRPFLIPTVDFVELPNGLTIYYLEGGIKNTIKFEWCFKAGRSTEKVKLVSKMCHSLIKEGTDKYTGYEVAEYFDFYGSELNQNPGLAFTSKIKGPSLLRIISTPDTCRPSVSDAFRITCCSSSVN